ncbi:MAG: cupin domain-containing protein [Acidobacteriota bacterium]
MAVKIDSPSLIDAAGTDGKVIREFFGMINSGDKGISIAHMTSPSGWVEPGQRPDFDEYTIVLKGQLHVETNEENHEIKAGQAIIIRSGEWVKYSSPKEGGAEYIAVCLPAFSPDSVNRDDITL